VGGAWEDDKEAMAYFEDNADAISEKIGDVRTAAVKKQVSDLLSGLPEGVSAEFINSLL